MIDYFFELFSSAQFVPHAVCLLWRPDLLIMHGVSDVLITFAYLTIPFFIVKAARARPDLLNHKVAWMFASFITACGLSHAAGLLTLWFPAYGLQGVIKIATAAVSVYTAAQLGILLPGFLAMPSSASFAKQQNEIATQKLTISDQRTLLAEGEKSELFSNLIRASKDAVFIWTKKDGALFWNRGASEMYGYSEAEVLGKRPSELTQTSFSISRRELEAALRTSGIWRGDIQEKAQDGRDLMVASTVQEIKVDDRIFRLAINRDVTSERAAERKIEAQSRLIDLSHDAIVTWTEQGGIQSWNRGAELLYGYSREEVLGRVTHDIFQTKHPVPWSEIDEALHTKGGWAGSVQHRTKDGQIVEVFTRHQVIDSNGTRLILETNRDVSDLRETEKKLERHVVELQRSNRELDEFAYTASHDLKEPLRGIAINAEFLSRIDLPEEGRKRVDRMASLADRMEKLVSDLLYFSRLGRGERVVKDIDTKHIIEGTIKELSEWMLERNGTVNLNGELPCLTGERSKIKTVFQNFIVNGLKYNDAVEKIVEIGFEEHAEVDGQSVRNAFYVRDNGIGIAKQNFAKVFQMFKRLNAESDYGPGTGAGLSFVRKIVEEYGGTISIVSNPGNGSTFYFTLPLAAKKNQAGSQEELI